MRRGAHSVMKKDFACQIHTVYGNFASEITRDYAGGHDSSVAVWPKQAETGFWPQGSGMIRGDSRSRIGIN